MTWGISFHLRECVAPARQENLVNWHNLTESILPIKLGATHPLLPASHLDLVPQLAQNVGDLLALFTLDFDHAILDRPTAATGLLELLRQRGQIPF